MDLSERKRKILQAIIDEYIGTAEPVGSRAISKKKDLGLSSATIRNEMADLEDMGYLIQPHTSAGRIPSDEGYRFYVSSLMQRYNIGMEAIAELHKQLVTKVSQLDMMIKKASLLTSALTNYATVITMPGQNLARIQKIDLVPVGSAVMMIVVTNTGNVRHEALRVAIDSESLAKLAGILNEKLAGLTVNEIDYPKLHEIQNSIESALDIHPMVLISILNFAYETITALDEREVYLNNARSILNYPEYKDVEKAKEIFDFLDDKKNLRKLIGDKNPDNDISVKIGAENEFEELKDCSLVTVNYTVGDNAAGKIGVIGPKRMDYAKVFASLDIISKQIDNIIRLYLESE